MGRVRAAVIGLAVLAAGALVAPEADAIVGATRISGADRYETAANLSLATFDPGVNVAYLATGQSFADALSAGPAAGFADGPVLLTLRDTLPAITKTEILRLDPDVVVVVGGPAAISDAVEDEVDAAIAGTTTRIFGLDRYETSAVVSAHRFVTPGVPVAYVATGENFPDALSGGAAASVKGGPLLLTEKMSIPTAVVNELDRLNPARIVLLGGTDAVSDLVLLALNGLTATPGNAQRVAGADRYRTSVQVSEDTFPDGGGGATVAYLATGENFPDALAAAAAAGQAPVGPVLLARTTCIPPTVNDELDRLDGLNGDATLQVFVLGGEAALADTVLGRQECTS